MNGKVRDIENDVCALKEDVHELWVPSYCDPTTTTLPSHGRGRPPHTVPNTRSGMAPSAGASDGRQYRSSRMGCRDGLCVASAEWQCGDVASPLLGR